jgi:tRNA modification GTPase
MPAGRGAVAVVAVEGDDAFELVSGFFSPRNEDAWRRREIGRIFYGRWNGTKEDIDAPPEDVIVCCVNENAVEVHCHGGVAAAARISDDLTGAGGQPRDWKAWIAEREPNALRAAARIALASAPTERTANILLDQYNGSLETAIRMIAGRLESAPSQAAVELQQLVDRGIIGLHLTEPWRVVIAGAPNVGKSSLINAMLGYERAIVFDQPGTTRDVVRATTAFDGWPVALADTAGLRVSTDPIESEGILRAKQAASIADCLLLVFDASQRWTAECQTLADEWPAAIIVFNKSDLKTEPDLSKADGIFTSALQGQGIDDLIGAIVRRLIDVDLQPGDAVPFASEQIEQLEMAANLVRQGDSAAAKKALLALLK